MDSIYTEVTGTTCYVDGERGVVTGLHSEGKHLIGAFIRLDESREMLFVSLGKATGERRQWHEVMASRRISRDEFDQITTLDTLRRDLGWAA